MKHASSIISVAMGAIIAALGTDDAAIAAPEQIGCYGDNWGPTLEMLEPMPIGPLTFKTLRCLPIQFAIVAAGTTMATFAMEN